MSDRVRTGTLSLALAAVLFTAAGCGGSSFVGRHYDNFTAYYNTFYNARQAFDEGVKAFAQTDEPVDRRYYIDVFPAPDRAANSDKFQDAIDKSADVLRDHPDSKWVDDALLLIGKSYFYQQNFVGAEQKFREVVDIGSALEDEARLWLARTLIAAGALDEARDHLIASLGQEGLSERWEPRIRLALGELYVKRESYEEAAEELEAGLENIRDNELEARGWLLLGQVLETLEQYEDAVDAYRRVSGAHPRYELSYAANISAVRVQGLYFDAEDALRELRRMQRDDKNFNSRLEIAYLNGLIYQAEGREHDALDQYYEILYDSEGQIGDLRGRIHYALGELYEDDEDYLTASAHYDTAKTALPTIPTGGRSQEQFAPEAITDAARKAEVFGTFAEVRTEIANIDSLLALGSLDEEEFMERILEIRRARAEELSEQQRLIEQRQAERGFQDAAARISDSGRGSNSNEPTGEAGFLFHKDPVRVQESRMSFITRWGDRPLVPNWRRSEAVAAASTDPDSPDGGVASRIRDNSAGVGQNPLPPIDYSDVPRDSLSQARMKATRALARYELGNVLFLSMNRPDSAAVWYRMVIDEDRGENVAQRAYYALAEVQRSLGDTAAARTIYQQVLRDFPASDFAGRVREQLGIQEEVSSDSLAAAFQEYDQAFSHWRRGFHREALSEMVSVAANYKRTEVAPKALLAAGRIFLEWAEKDSLSIFEPLPLNVDEKVLEDAGLVGDVGLTDQVGSQSDETADRTAPREQMPNQLNNGSGEPPTNSDEKRSDLEALKAAEREALEREAAENGTLEREAAESGAVTPRTRVEATEPTDEPGDEIAALDPQDDAVPNRPSDTEPQDVRIPPADTSSASPAAADSAIIRAGLTLDQPSNSPPPLLAAADDDEVYLHTLYSSIKERYPTSVYANQAEEMLSALESFRAQNLPAGEPESAADTTQYDQLAADSTHSPADSILVQVDAPSAQAQADSTADRSGEPSVPAQADSTADRSGEPSMPAQADSTAEQPAPIASDSTTGQPALISPDSTVARSADAGGNPPVAGVAEGDSDRAIPSGEGSLHGEGGIEEDLGGFTLVLGMNVKQSMMEELAAKYAAKGYRTDVIAEKVGGTTLYRAALGHFPSAEQAHRALSQFGSAFEPGTQVAPLSDADSPQ